MNTNEKKRLCVALIVAGVLMFSGCDAIAEFLGLGGEESGAEEDGGGNPLEPAEPGTPSPEPAEPGSPSPGPVILGYFVDKDGNDANNGETAAAPFATLEKAYTAALRDSVRKRIVVLSNPLGANAVILDASAAANNPVVGDSLVTIAGGSAGITLQRNQAENGSVVTVKGGAKIVFENIRINGKIAPGNDDQNANDRALLVTGTGTQVTLGNDVVLTGKKYDDSGTVFSSNQGAGVYITSGAALTMTGNSEVTGCVQLRGPGAGIAVYYGSLTIEENARIYENTSTDWGGGVYLCGSSTTTGNMVTTFTMNGGEISGNTTAGSGGGVRLYYYRVLFEMNGGQISGNTVAEGGYGGGVSVTYGTFTMNGGVIYGNETTIDETLRNTATYGAAVNTNSSSNVSTSNSTIDKRTP
jgi:hypothetical protein